MKKFLKALLSLSVAIVCVFGFTACDAPLSATTVNVDKVELTNGVSTNGGSTVVHNGYLYFINGTKENNGKTSGKLGKICRVKLDVATGEIDEDTYEVVVNSFAGFDFGSISFFGDFMYYTSPCRDVNYKGTVLYNKTRFMRYDLKNKQTYTLYTTKNNSSSETIDFEYYVVGDKLNLVVYEKEAATITSLKIGNTVKTNYVIKNVNSCVLSENNGNTEIEGVNVDANSFVYYTKTHSITSDTEVYRVSPNKNNSTCIADDGYDITLLSVKNGKLIYSYSSKIYSKEIKGNENDELSIDLSDVISHNSYTYIIFLKQQDGSESVLYYDDADGAVVIARWENGVKLDPHTITNIGAIQTSSSSSDSAPKFAFIGTTTIEDIISTDDPETPEVENTVSETVTYLLYVKENVVYRLEIERENNIVEYAQPVKLTTTKVVIPDSILMPEVIGNYLYIFGNELNEKDKETGKIYMFRVDITIDENKDLEDLENKGVAEMIAVK